MRRFVAVLLILGMASTAYAGDKDRPAMNIEAGARALMFNLFRDYFGPE